VALVVFIIGAPVLVKNIAVVSKFYRQVEEKEIDASALFYSEESHTYRAEKAIRESLTTTKGAPASAVDAAACPDK
jgi:hypothetical protein